MWHEWFIREKLNLHCSNYFPPLPFICSCAYNVCSNIISFLSTWIMKIHLITKIYKNSLISVIVGAWRFSIKFHWKSIFTGLCVFFLVLFFNHKLKKFNLAVSRASSFKSGKWDSPKVISISFQILTLSQKYQMKMT